MYCVSLVIEHSMPGAATTPQLILASASPRRRHLLEEAGFANFAVVAPRVEEAHDPALTPSALTLENARRKAAAVAASHPDAVVLAADTLVYLDGDPLGKPADLDEARAMLIRLSGRWHEVCTGVVIRRGARAGELAVVTRVRFRPLDDAVITRYFSLCDPLDKAGAYGIQDGGDLIVERVEGSWSNVVGLPVEELGPLLHAFLEQSK
jgi:septum formation protein